MGNYFSKSLRTSTFLIRYSFFCYSVLFYSGLSYAEIKNESCDSRCHISPVFKKEDKNRLEECAQCHGYSTHESGYEVKAIAQGVVSLKEGKNFPLIPINTSQREDRGDLRLRGKESGYNNKIFENMVYIPEGEFIMGTDERLRDEKPAHIVYIVGFYIDIFEITNEDYKKFVDHTGYTLPDHWKGGVIIEGKEKHPVTYVSWYDANNYCKWMGKRLPRETEWEKAAGGIDGRVYPWGSKWDMNKSNNPLKEVGDTQPVGNYEKGKSPYGLYDMSGNVWEWVNDNYYPHPGSDYISPEFGDKYKLLKGGSWWDCSAYGCGISAPIYNRAFFEPPVKSKSYGFRCAKDKEEK